MVIAAIAVIGAIGLTAFDELAIIVVAIVKLEPGRGLVDGIDIDEVGKGYDPHFHGVCGIFPSVEIVNEILARGLERRNLAT